MDRTRWIFVWLFVFAIAYEIITAVAHRGDTISEMVWDLCAAQPFWRVVIVVLCLHFILGQTVYNEFLRLFK